jgi:hypothetical protein
VLAELIDLRKMSLLYQDLGSKVSLKFKLVILSLRASVSKIRDKVWAFV